MTRFVLSPDVVQQARRTETWVGREARKTKRTNRILATFLVLSISLNYLEGGALYYAVPLRQVMPVFFYVKPDGVMETALTTDSLPADLSDATVKAWLWQYVMHREGYSWVEADFNNHVVQAMSDNKVREQYEKWSSGKSKSSYLAMYGRSAVIRVGLRNITGWIPSTNGQEGRVTIQFDRVLYREGEPSQSAKPVTYSVTLSFIAGYNASGFDIRDILQFNPSRIVVTDYPGAVPDSAKPGEAP